MDTYKRVFERFVPEKAVEYCFKLWKHFGFEFKIKRSRLTKLGDYRYAPREKKHTITINNDLNPYAFLITYLHEVAHLVTYEQHGRKASPHGEEWKMSFRKVARPVLNEEVFPPQVLLALQRYFNDPKAASCSDPFLYNVLRKFDEPDGMVPLSKIQHGQTFVFNGKRYKKLEKRRTRSICLDCANGRKYLLAEVAQVKKEDNEEII